MLADADEDAHEEDADDDSGVDVLCTESLELAIGPGESRLTRNSGSRLVPECKTANK